MIQIINIANKINDIFESNRYTHKIFIESNFSLDVHYVRKDITSDEDITNTSRQEVFEKYNKGLMSLEEYISHLTEIERNSSLISNNNIEDYILEKLELDGKSYSIEFRSYTPEEYTEVHIANLFNGKPIESMSRFRLNGYFDENPQKIEGDIPPIVTFYSYKGGMARTTTMVSYAIERASQGKKVFIIDCDLEAPGYLNFFDLSEHKGLKSGECNGLVEMISDIEFCKANNDSEFDYTNYYVNIIHSNDNDKYTPYKHILENIFLMPAGNLNETNNEISSENREHYLEGLSRINLSNPQIIKSIFSDFFKYLKKINIDIILIDSRTGFSDIIFDCIKYFTNHLVAFFGSNNQSIPGLFNLLDEYNRNNNFGLTLINSILPHNEDSKFWIERFQEVYSHYSKGLNGYEVKPLHRVADFEKIGIKHNAFNGVSLIDYILQRKNDDYNNIFDELNGSLFANNSNNSTFPEQQSINSFDSKFEKSHIPQNNDLKNNISQYDYLYTATTLRLKQNILHELKSTLKKIKSFAEDCDIDDKLFYYRDCMNDLFEQDKFLIRGYKGTGKTYLYLALEQPKILKNLLNRANFKRRKNGDTLLSEDTTYISIQVIDTNAVSIKKKFFEFGDFINPSTIHIYNFKRFWRLHTWNSILLDDKFKDIRETSKYCDYIKDIVSDTAIELYKKCLTNDNLDLFIAIDEDMKKVNDRLVNNNQKLFILYDQLDSRINPLYWNEVVSPLINYWKDYYSTYSNILPKIFVRTDLMRRIQGTNTARLHENFIEIEWSINEIFAYFIKLSMTNDFARKCLEVIITKRIKKYSNAKNFPTDEKLINNQYQLDNILDASISPYVYAFFGSKVVDSTGRYWGNPYRYFENNLCNADKKSISLRPFINTMDNNAIEVALEDNTKHVTAIIPSKSYTKKDVKDKAAITYFDDLTQDDFSKDLIKFKDFLDAKEGDPFRFKSLDRYMYEKLLQTVFDKYKEEFKIVKNIDELNTILEANGIIAEKITREGKYYQFAPLYYYIWALKNSSFDYKEEKEYQEVGYYKKEGPKCYVVTPENKYEVKYCDSFFKINQQVMFDLKCEKHISKDGKLFWYATNLKPYVDNEVIEG